LEEIGVRLGKNKLGEFFLFVWCLDSNHEFGYLIAQITLSRFHQKTIKRPDMGNGLKSDGKCDLLNERDWTWVWVTSRNTKIYKIPPSASSSATYFREWFFHNSSQEILFLEEKQVLKRFKMFLILHFYLVLFPQADSFSL
jgi:hypothetical protein